LARQKSIVFVDSRTGAVATQSGRWRGQFFS
jgi:hypothetical protein